jgi:hypothetical protein
MNDDFCSSFFFFFEMNEAKDQILQILASFHSNQESLNVLHDFFHEAIKEISTRNCSSTCDVEKNDRLIDIIYSVRDYLGANILAMDPEENISIPTWDPSYESYNSQNTVHVDSFIYSEDDVDELCDLKKISRHKCADCGSINVEPLSIIFIRE